jgi:hypothetical protein
LNVQDLIFIVDPMAAVGIQPLAAENGFFRLQVEQGARRYADDEQIIKSDTGIRRFPGRL